MSLLLRIMLVVVSLLTTVFILKKIRKSKAQIEDSIFWVFFSLLTLLFSIFPSVADFCAYILGIHSTLNFIFLFFIFVLIIKIFFMSAKISTLEFKINELVQRVALDKKLDEDKCDCVEKDDYR